MNNRLLRNRKAQWQGPALRVLGVTLATALFAGITGSIIKWSLIIIGAVVITKILFGRPKDNG